MVEIVKLWRNKIIADVKFVTLTEAAFAAINTNGAVVTWGDPEG